MATFPEFQKKAQAEIYSVIGPERLPEYNDRESLPYIESLYREVLRWRPPGPLGVPHFTASDDVYKGYLIPKGRLLPFMKLMVSLKSSSIRDSRICKHLVRILSSV